MLTARIKKINLPEATSMPTELWILIAAGVVFALGLVYFIVLQILRAREEWKKIDYTKIRKWKDDDW
jgi:hypothetical protein